MTRPLLPILFGFISGILVEYHWSLIERMDGRHFGNGAHLTLIGVYAVLLCIWYVLYRLNYSRLSTYWLLLIAIVIGMTRYAAHMHTPVHHISHFVENERVTIEGFLYKPPESGVSFFQNRFRENHYLYVETIWIEQGELRYRVCGKVLITLMGPRFPHSKKKPFSYGDTIRTRLRLHIPKDDKDSGDFDYREYLRRRGIYLVGYLDSDRYIINLPECQGNPILTWIYILRDRIVRFLDMYSPTQIQDTSEAIQVIKAMTLGTSRELSPEVKEKFRHSGMYHFLVISGIHIGILVWVFHQLLHILHIPLRYRSIVLTAILLLYAGLTGFHFPVLRATIMAVVLYFSITCNRIPDPLYSLAFSVSIILFIFPTALFEVSFQLTVAATTSILFLYRCLTHFTWWERFSCFPYLVRLPLMTLLMAAGAMIGISPLLIFYFQQLYPYSLISNLIALPAISLLLPFSLFSSLLSLFLPWNLVHPLLSVNVFLAKWFTFLTTLFPEFDVVLPQPTPLMLVFYYIIVYCGLNVYQKNSLLRETMRIIFTPHKH
jgi:competence protein ComEC